MNDIKKTPFFIIATHSHEIRISKLEFLNLEIILSWTFLSIKFHIFNGGTTDILQFANISLDMLMSVSNDLISN